MQAWFWMVISLVCGCAALAAAFNDDLATAQQYGQSMGIFFVVAKLARGGVGNE